MPSDQLQPKMDKMKLLLLITLAVLASPHLSGQNHPIGHRSMNFVDPGRNDRPVPSEIYYPAQAAGNNTPVADGKFPVIVFGHGFLMPYSAYSYLTNTLVPLGYSLVFTTTEGGLIPDHAEYGADLAFLILRMKSEGADPSSPFYLHVDSTSAVMGHSMGGGASFLACKNNTNPTVMVTMAAAETNPSAIEAATKVVIPNLVFAADEDCVTPPPQNQQPMYDSLASACKFYANIKGGGHCYFADYNITCSLGEIGCQQNFTITREEQHDVTLDFSILFFDYFLKKNGSVLSIFIDSLGSSTRISNEMKCTTTGVYSGFDRSALKPCPNPVSDDLMICLPETAKTRGRIVIRSLTGIQIKTGSIDPAISGQVIRIDVSSLPSGFYFVEFSFNNKFFHCSFIKK